MKKITTLFILTLSAFNIAFADSSLDSLKQQLQTATQDSTKAIIYSKLANCYLNMQNVPNAYTKRINQENAINYTMLALHLYSKRSDTTGLTQSYSDLAKAYRSQRKYAQAKWFVLQANTLSRQQKSIPAIITSLVDLASIKMDIDDYLLAKKDLKEAYKLAVLNKELLLDSLVKNAYTRFYVKIKVPENENIFSSSVDNEIIALEKEKALKTVVPLKKAAIKQKKLVAEAAPVKKKIYTVNNKQTYTGTVVSL